MERAYVDLYYESRYSWRCTYCCCLMKLTISRTSRPFLSNLWRLPSVLLCVQNIPTSAWIFTQNTGFLFLSINDLCVLKLMIIFISNKLSYLISRYFKRNRRKKINVNLYQLGKKIKLIWLLQPNLQSWRGKIKREIPVLGTLDHIDCAINICNFFFF